MEEILKKLAAFLPYDVTVEPMEEDEGFYDLIELSSGESVGALKPCPDGTLSSFVFIGELDEGSIRNREALAIAKNFLKAFQYDQSAFELSGVLELEGCYMVIYEKKDERYGKFLPGSGLTISVATSGHVIQFSFDGDEEYIVQYPETMITAEEAKKAYMSHLGFELVWERLDSEVYREGDDEFHLVYRLMGEAMDIPANGKEPETITEEDLYSDISQSSIGAEPLDSLLGFQEGKKWIGEVADGPLNIQLWSSDSAIPESEFSFDLSEPDSGIVKLGISVQCGKLVYVMAGSILDDFAAPEIGLAKAKERAAMFLAALYPDAESRFKMEDTEPEVAYMEEDLFGTEADSDDVENDEYDFDEENGFLDEEDECEDEESPLETGYEFFIHQFHHGVRVEGYSSVLEVGKHTGKIIFYQENVAEIPWNDREPNISREEAKEIFSNELSMELSWVRESLDDETVIYTLSYLPSFLNGPGHIRLIDGKTGKPFHAEVGDAAFY